MNYELLFSSLKNMTKYIPKEFENIFVTMTIKPSCEMERVCPAANSCFARIIASRRRLVVWRSCLL